MKKILVAALLAVAAAAVCAEPATFAIDPDHTVVTFEVSHVGTSTHRGRFRAKEGSVTLDRVARTGKADIALDMATVSIAAPTLEGVLKGERVFNVTQNPVARFVADSFAFDGDKVASATGTLTIVGKSQPTTLKAVRFNCYQNNQLKREVCGGDFETTIQRSQFGLGFAPGAASDDVKLLIQVEGIRQ